MVLLALATQGGSARAQQPTNPAAADTAFKQGRELFKAEKFEEACEQFETSQRLDPANGTLFNIAQCSAKIGRFATAAEALRTIIANDSNEQRKKESEERLREIEPRIAKLVVKIEPPPAGLAVELSNKSGTRKIEANQPVEIDLGDFTLVARARGYSEFMSKVTVDKEAETVTVVAMLVSGASNAEAAGIDSDEDSSGPGAKRRIIGIGAAATGGVAVVGGIVLGSLARSKWQDAKDVCGGTTCSTQDALDRANDFRDEARSKAMLSTIFVIGGAAVAGAGAYLLFTMPDDVQVSPTASDTGAGLTISGAF